LRTYGILLIGLYRFRDTNSTVAQNPSAKRYVITNPPDDFILMSSDKVGVDQIFTKSEEGGSGWLGYFEDAAENNWISEVGGTAKKNVQILAPSFVE